MKKLYLILLLIVFCNIAKAESADSIIELLPVFVRGEFYPARTVSRLTDTKRDTIKLNRFRIHRFRIQRKYFVDVECVFQNIRIPGRVASIERWSFEAENERIFRKHINNNFHVSDSIVKNFYGAPTGSTFRDGSRVKFKIDSDCHIKDVEILSSDVNYFIKQEILSVFHSVPKSVIQEVNMLCGATYYIEIIVRLNERRPRMTSGGSWNCSSHYIWKNIRR